jgi:putative nucleotidyltransferase with HDIG domain
VRDRVTAKLLVEQIETLPPLAPIASRILAVTDSPNSSASDVARVLCEDPAIVAKILRVANSPFYGVTGRISEVSRAVVILGAVAIRNLVVGLCAQDSLSTAGADCGAHHLLWRHSIAVAAASDLIATRVDYDPPEEALLAGLLHDIGQLAMATLQPKAFEEVLSADDDTRDLLQREEDGLGVHHANAGEQILKKWQLPSVLCRVARSHHDAKVHQGGAHAPLLSIVMLADKLAYFLGAGLEEDSVHANLTPALIAKLGLCDEDVCTLLERLERRIAEAAEMLGIGDVRAEQDELPHPRNVLWVTPDGAPRNTLRRWVLEQSGYRAQHTSEAGLADLLQRSALILIDLPDQRDSAILLAQGLAERGYRRVVLIQATSGQPDRATQGMTSGVITIPEWFSVFDLRWVEEQLAS